MAITIKGTSASPGIKIGKAELKNVVFAENELKFRIVTEDVNIPLDINSNYGWVPLRLGWRKAAIDFILVRTGDDDNPYYELTGPHSDCD